MRKRKFSFVLNTFKLPATWFDCATVLFIQRRLRCASFTFSSIPQSRYFCRSVEMKKTERERPIINCMFLCAKRIYIVTTITVLSNLHSKAIWFHVLFDSFGMRVRRFFFTNIHPGFSFFLRRRYVRLLRIPDFSFLFLAKPWLLLSESFFLVFSVASSCKCEISSKRRMHGPNEWKTTQQQRKQQQRKTTRDNW